MSKTHGFFMESSETQSLDHSILLDFGRSENFRTMFVPWKEEREKSFDTESRYWHSLFLNGPNGSSVAEDRDFVQQKEVREGVDRLTQLALAEDVEPGNVSLVQIDLEKMIESNPNLAQQVVQEVYLNNSSNVKVLTSLISALAYISKEALKTQANLIALAAFSHKSNEVKEWSIRAFELWGDPESIEFLKNHQVGIKWLDSYRLDVIRDLEVGITHT